MPSELHRHQLVYLSPHAWDGVLSSARDAQAREILGHWQAHALPLVVARQSAGHAQAGLIALGLPAPGTWQRRRMALDVPSCSLAGTREFPRIGELAGMALPPASQQAVQSLQDSLGAAGVTAHVFGSHGWQRITGLPYLRPGSDLDLWVPVRHAAQADRIAGLLDDLPQPSLRVDAELVFPGGLAVAWREWAAWRAGRVRAVLVKGLDGVALREDRAWCAPAAAQGVTA